MAKFANGGGVRGDPRHRWAGRVLCTPGGACRACGGDTTGNNENCHRGQPLGLLSFLFRNRDFVPLSPRPTPTLSAHSSHCHLNLPPLSSRPAPAAIPTYPRCHLDRRERSHAVIIRPKKGILGITRFLASLRNDRGGLEMTTREARNDSGDSK